MSEQDWRIAEAIEREQGRLRNFIRKRVPDRRDVEDVLQDVFFELVEAYRLKMTPTEREEFAKGASSRWARTESPEPEPKA